MSPYSVRMWKNTDQNNSEYGHFLRSDSFRNFLKNTLTADDEYSRHNRENLPLPIQTQLSKKLKTFCCFFIAFFGSTLNFELFQKKKKKKIELRSLTLKLLTLKDAITETSYIKGPVSENFRQSMYY